MLPKTHYVPFYACLSTVFFLGCGQTNNHIRLFEEILARTHRVVAFLHSDPSIDSLGVQYFEHTIDTLTISNEIAIANLRDFHRLEGEEKKYAVLHGLEWGELYFSNLGQEVISKRRDMYILFGPPHDEVVYCVLLRATRDGDRTYATMSYQNNTLSFLFFFDSTGAITGYRYLSMAYD